MEALSTLLSNEGKLTRHELALAPTPQGTTTHRPVPHVEVVNALVETLGFRHIGANWNACGAPGRRPDYSSNIVTAPSY